MVMVLIESVIYLCVGIALMLLGHWIIDLCIPVDFPKEINEGNKAVGYVSAGIYAGLGYVLRTAIMSFEIEEALTITEGLIDSAVYALLGIGSFVLAYFAIDIVNKKFNFNIALKEKNEAAGIMIFGIFLGCAFLVSGVIQ